MFDINKIAKIKSQLKADRKPSKNWGFQNKIKLNQIQEISMPNEYFKKIDR